MDTNAQPAKPLSEEFPNVVREGITKEELLCEYNKWGTTYDKDVEKVGYAAYQTAARKMSELFPKESRERVKILDVGAGTGLLGIQLKEEGFTRLDALDPAKNMLAEAEKKGVYDNYFVEYLTEKPTSISKDTYDVVAGSGMIGFTLVPYTAIYEMIRLTKQGGYVVLSIRKDCISYKEYEQLEPTMDTLEKQGIWKQVCRTVYPNFSKDCEGGGIPHCALFLAQNIQVEALTYRVLMK